MGTKAFCDTCFGTILMIESKDEAATKITVWTVYVFLYGRLYLVLSGLDEALATGKKFIHSLSRSLLRQSFVQLGFLMALPMMMEIGLERGFRTALSDVVLIQLQLASVFFTFSPGTKTNYYGTALLHGGAECRATGRGFSYSVYCLSWVVIFVILAVMKIAQAIKPVVARVGLWGSIKALARGYEIIMGLMLFTLIAFLAWFPFVSKFQIRMLFNQAFS